MLRSRGNRLPSERAALSISLRRPGRACRLSLSLSLSFHRAPSAPGSLSLSLSPSLSVASCIPRRPAARPSGIEDLSLILLLFSSLARKGIAQRDERFPSSLGILSILFIVCRFSSTTTITSSAPPSLPLDPRSRRYRCIRTHTSTYIYIYTYIHTHIHIHTNHTGAHIVPAENRAFFRARPRFLARFHSDPP